MKNRIAYLQYIKKFELCHAISGYVFYIKLYAGKDFASNNRSVVMDLMRKCHLLNKGYHLFTDNFYAKPLLARILDTEGTLLTETVRSNSKGLPAIPAKLNVGQMVQFRDGNSLFVAFREKKSQRKPVLMLSTSEAAGMMQVRTGAGVIKRKPKCIAAYNKYMGGVDISHRREAIEVVLEENILQLDRHCIAERVRALPQQHRRRTEAQQTRLPRFCCREFVCR